jgi:hypothetical protein
VCRNPTTVFTGGDPLPALVFVMRIHFTLRPGLEMTKALPDDALAGMKYSDAVITTPDAGATP